ncbi:hypothetical protein [Streptomyces uncialis]|uniref:hypothetical protein n=1 Tax=Streptomyces uncialis TaxID=1048205 RepID=UPI00378B5618
MASYHITGKTATREPVIAVSIAGIEQESGTVIDEMDIVNAVRAVVAAAPGVDLVAATRYVQVTTQV